MENAQTPVSSSPPSNSRMVISFAWVLSLLAATYIGFSFGQGAKSSEPKVNTNVLSTTLQPTNTPVPAVQNVPADTTAPNTLCSKFGFAQKWEYLTAYVIKENDSLEGIVKSELKDSTRLNEVMQLNGNGPLVVGATLYLPPSIVTKSSGNIRQVHGKLVEKNASSWHVSFNSDKSGQGILIPTYWFGEISNKDAYTIGSCVTVLFDDGYKVFSVEAQ